ncbi:hypothetical protein Cpir12675_004812 [Ceratocystis pirilliformis]|uniref:Uncharacterized protein n=1 Tax=Ceratocystis pirilliformis TaxID=259994 RepID=A0ABR3YVA5_9PEZI
MTPSPLAHSATTPRFRDSRDLERGSIDLSFVPQGKPISHLSPLPQRNWEEAPTVHFESASPMESTEDTAPLSHANKAVNETGPGLRPTPNVTTTVYASPQPGRRFNSSPKTVSWWRWRPRKHAVQTSCSQHGFSRQKRRICGLQWSSFLIVAAVVLLLSVSAITSIAVSMSGSKDGNAINYPKMDSTNSSISTPGYPPYS